MMLVSELMLAHINATSTRECVFRTKLAVECR